MTSPAAPRPDLNPAGLAWLPQVFSIFQGVPFPIWAAIVWQESNFNPLAHNTGTPSRPEDSVGLLQLNRKVPAWGQYSVSYLQDPIHNAILGSRDIRAAYQQYGDNMALVAVHSGHPGLIDPNSDAVKPYVAKYNALKNMDPMAAVSEILKGALQPITGPGGILDPGAWLDPGAIGSGIVSGITSGLTGWWDGLKAGGADKLVDTFAPAVMFFTGTTLVAFGVFGAVLQSKPAQAAAGAAEASGNPYAVAAGAGVKAVGGDSAAPVRGAVRVRQMQVARRRAEGQEAARGRPRP